jgi:hemerythrin-like domain-containing protein
VAKLQTEKTAPIRNHHRELLEHLEIGTDTIYTLEPEDIEERSDEIEGFIRFLDRELKPHAKGEEEFLYPPIDELIRQHGRPTEVMSIDHSTLLDWIEGLRANLDEARNESNTAEERHQALGRVKRITAQIDSLLTLHLEKENYVLLRFLDEFMDQKEIDEIIRKIREMGG